MHQDSLVASQRDFYRDKYHKYRDDPRALAWRDQETQELRFDECLHLLHREPADTQCSLHEVGCGLAHMKHYLNKKNYAVRYSGSDIVPEFVERAQETHPESEFICADIASQPQLIGEHDFVCLSGTFHTIGHNAQPEWQRFIETALRNMFQSARKGICFNFLTIYSEYQDPMLYYMDPGSVINWCSRHLTRFIETRHAVPLYEFFVYVYKEEYVQSLYPRHERYFN